MGGAGDGDLGKSNKSNYLLNAVSESGCYAFYLQFLFLWQPSKIDGIITILEKKKTKFQKVLPVVLYN